MKRQTLLKSTLCLLMALVCNVVWAQTTTIQVSTSEESPRYVYALKSAANHWMTSYTSPTDTEANRGVFAFFADDENTNAYKIFSVERQGWVSYTKAASYSDGANKAILVETQSEANAWNITYLDNYFQIAPYKSDGTAAATYWNWYGGIGTNVLDNTNKTIGLYNKGAVAGNDGDNGSRWTLVEVNNYDFTQVKDLSFTLTDQFGKVHSYSYKGVAEKTKPGISGIENLTISNETLNNGGYAATIGFPVPVSNAEVDNYVFISPFSKYTNKYFAEGTSVKANRNSTVPFPTNVDAKYYLWSFYPTYDGFSLKLKIKNIGTDTYIKSVSNQNDHSGDEVSLVDTEADATPFALTSTNELVNELGYRLSVNTERTGTAEIQQVGTYGSSHSGTKNKIVNAKSYTLTLADGSTFVGTNGVHNLVGGSYTYSNGAWSDNGYSATVDFDPTTLPFPISTAEKVNPTMISSFNEGAGGYGPGRFKWYAAKDDDGDDDVKIKRDALVTEDLIEAYSWAIYPSMENGAFAYSIKNVALGKYIQATKSFDANKGDNNEGTIILSDTPTKFSVDSNNSLYFFANEMNQYLSLGSSSTTEGFLGIHTKTYAAGHKGITNAFLTPRYALASKDELKSGGIYTFLTARGWVGATDSDNVIATANTAVTPAASTENAMFQWALYQSKNGNYYLYNLGKKMFMGDVDQSVNEGNIPFAGSPMNKNMTFKDNAQAANFPIMFSTNNTHAVSQNTAKGLFAWKGGWNNNDEGSNHQVSYIGELDAEQLKTIADLVEAYDKSMPMKVEVEGSWENNPNTHFGNLTVTTGSVVATTKLTLKNMEISYVEYAGAGDVFNFTREYRGFEFQGFFLGEENLGKSFAITEELASSITAENPLVAKFTATEAVTLFYDDDEYSYRIPAIATTGIGRIFAVSDYRHNLDDIGRDNHGTGTKRIDLVARYSDDNGKTWSETMTIAAGDNSKSGSYLRAFGDAAIAAVGQNIVVMAAAGDQVYTGASTTSPNRMARIFSSDNGKTWTISEMTTKMYNSASSLVPNGVAAFFGSGKLVVDANFNGTEKARIYGALLVRTYINGSYNNYNNYVIYSDDLGETWSILGGSTNPIASGDEPKVEILPNGQILLSARRGGGRVFNVFTYTDKANNAGTWDTAANGCGNGGSNATNGEIFCVDAKKADGTAVKLLMQSQPKGGGGQYDRKDVTIWYKEIDANTTYTTATIKDNWIEGLQVSHQQSSYSAVTMQPDGKIALFFEEAPCYADDYTKGYCMVYLPLTIEQITKNKYFSLNADLTTERNISVVLTDAQGNEYRKQVTSALGGVATKLTTDYPFITLGDNATLESDGESFTYTNTVTLPFKVSNENNTPVWHNIYFPINTNENNYPAYMSAEENSDVVKIVTESAVYGNSTLNTLENAGKISWAIYQSEDDDFAFILINKSNGQYLKTTSAAPTGSGNENVRYTSSINEAAAFVPSTEGHDQSYQGKYSLKIDNGYVCVWSVGNGYVTYSQNKSHKGAWVKFVEAPDFETLFAEVNAVLNMFGDGLGQYSNITEANLAAVTAAKNAMQTPGSVNLNTLNEYKNYTSKTEGGRLNLPEDGQFFRVAYDYGGSVGKLYMQGENSTIKGVKFTADKGAASIWQYRDGGLYSYTAEKYLHEVNEDRGLKDTKMDANFSASTRAKGKYNITCTSYIHANSNGNGQYYSDHCSSNNCAEHDFILEEIEPTTVTISNLGYSTLYSEVALSIPDGVKAYTGTFNETETTITLELHPLNRTIPANTGVVLESQFEEGEEKGEKTFNFNITAKVNPIEGNILRGTATGISTSVALELAPEVTNGVVYTLQQKKVTDESGNETYLDEVVFGQYIGETLAAGKAYLVLPEGQNAISIRFEGTTDIEHSTLNPQPSTQIYDLMGRRVEAMTKGGIYIVNGKKVVIK